MNKYSFIENAKPIVGKQGTDLLMYGFGQMYKDLIDYTNSGISIDFEILMGVDYSEIMYNNNLQLMMKGFDITHQYNSEDMLFLILRHLITITYKYEAFRDHLLGNNILMIDNKWKMALIEFTHEEIHGKRYDFEVMPSWLANAKKILAYAPNHFDMERLQKVEIAILKSSKLSASCRKLMTTEFITFDFMVYTILMDATKIMLSGYRTQEKSKTSHLKITEPVIGGIMLLLSLDVVMRGNGNIQSIRPTPPMFEDSDVMICKGIVSNQINFILAHEYTHLLKDHQLDKNDRIKSEQQEFEADYFAAEWTMSCKQTIQIFNEDNEIKGDSVNVSDAIGLLFVIIELMDFIHERFVPYSKGQLKYLSNDTHPRPFDRLRRLIEDHEGLNGSTELILYSKKMLQKMKKRVFEMEDHEKIELYERCVEL